MTPTLQPLFDLYIKPYLAAVKMGIIALAFASVAVLFFVVGKKYEEGNTIEAENKVSLLLEAQRSQLTTIAALNDANMAWERVADAQQKRHVEELSSLNRTIAASKSKEARLEKKLKEAYEKDTEWATTPIPTSYGRVFDEARKD